MLEEFLIQGFDLQAEIFSWRPSEIVKRGAALFFPKAPVPGDPPKANVGGREDKSDCDDPENE